MVATQAILSWTFISECPIWDDVNDLLVNDAQAIAVSSVCGSKGTLPLPTALS
jgi:hypothetical protein